MRRRSDRRPSRFVDGFNASSGAVRTWTQARLRLAQTADEAMARAGLTRPAVFVSGFWRSGTTWLLESLADALGAKTVFEPLSPLSPARRAVLRRRFGDDEDAAQAFIPGSDDRLGDVLPLLDRAMVGCADSAFGMSCRRSPRDSLRRQVVVKDVRAQSSLAVVHARFHVPVVHVRRHPCAVVASLVRARWHWSFERVRLATVLPALPRDLDVDPADLDRDEISRIASAWAWSERCAAAQLAGQGWGRIVLYEDFAGDPQRTFARLCEDLRLEPRHAVSFDVPSASIDPTQFGTQNGTIERWRRDLAPEDVLRIQRIASAVFPGWRKAI